MNALAEPTWRRANKFSFLINKLWIMLLGKAQLASVLIQKQLDTARFPLAHRLLLWKAMGWFYFFFFETLHTFPPPKMSLTIEKKQPTHSSWRVTQICVSTAPFTNSREETSTTQQNLQMLKRSHKKGGRPILTKHCKARALEKDLFFKWQKLHWQKDSWDSWSAEEQELSGPRTAGRLGLLHRQQVAGLND